MSADNKSIGRFILDGILPAPRGIPQVEVTFDIDANSILSVSAQDKGTGKEQKIVIQASSGLSDEEIDKMKEDAKANEEEDARKRVEIQTRNEADSLVYSTEKLIEDNADKVPEDLKSDVEGKVAVLKAAIEANDVAQMQTAMAELSTAMQQIGQAVYSQGGTPESDVSPDGQSDSGDDTVEGEFREV